MQEIKETLKQAIKKLYNLDFDPDITPSPENIKADYSTNAPLKLTKELHKSPMEIASEMEAFISGNGGFSSAPGFLNFILPDDYLYNVISNYNYDYSSDMFKDKTVICEFSDPNPFKILHVGHLYTSIVGDSISRLFEYAGAKVIRANFGGHVRLNAKKPCRPHHRRYC